MATDHRGNPINNNNLPKTTKDRMGLSDEQIQNPDGTFRQLSERDLAEGYEEGSMTYPDGTTTYPEPYDEPDDDGLGDTKYEPPMIARDEDGNRLDHSSMLPSQHQTGSGYGY